MERFAVESSQIESVGYNKTLRVLEVCFKRSKAIYQYADVPLGVYTELMDPLRESVGKFFNSSIRDKFTFTKCAGPTCQYKGCAALAAKGSYCAPHAETMAKAEEQANASTEEKDRREQETEDEEAPESACSPNTAHPDSGSSEV